MKNILRLLLIVTLFIGCQRSKKKIIPADPKSMELKKDSTKIEAADLPIIIDSTNYLIHPIGYVEKYSSRGYLSKSSGTSYNISNHNGYFIRGEFSNIMFQHIDSSSLNPLFNKVVEIYSLSFLEEIKANTGLEYLVFKVKDADTNGDSKLNYDDITALYISNIDGSNLRKLTKELHQIISWKILPELNRLYIKSTSDTDKNGKLDKQDRIVYEYINLTDAELKSIEYNPIN